MICDMCIYIYIYIYTSRTCAQDHTQGIMNINLLLYINIYTYVYMYCLLHFADYCLFPIAYCLTDGLLGKTLVGSTGGVIWLVALVAGELRMADGGWFLTRDETWSRDVVVLHKGFFQKVSALSTIMQKLRMRGYN